MPEPEDIVQIVCTTRGMGVNFIEDRKMYWILVVDLPRGEIETWYNDIAFNNSVDQINSFLSCVEEYTWLPMARLPHQKEYKRFIKIDFLLHKDITYFRMSSSRWLRIIDDQRSMFYRVNNTHVYFDLAQKSGIDIVDGEDNVILYTNISPDVRGVTYKNKGYVWNKDEFPYENMTILQEDAWHVYANQFRIYVKGDLYDYKDIICGQLIGLEKQFSGVILDTFSLPKIQHKENQTLLKSLSEVWLRDYITIDFNHSPKNFFPEDNRKILVIDYDGYEYDKSFKFFDPSHLTYKQGDVVYHDVDLTTVKLDPKLIAKSSKVNLYTFNGQSPFPGAAQLVVK